MPGGNPALAHYSRLFRSSLAPLQCFGTANHGQRQNESVLVYQLPPWQWAKPLDWHPKAFWLVLFQQSAPRAIPWHMDVGISLWLKPTACAAQRQDLGLGDAPEQQVLSLLHTISCFQQLFQKLRAAVMCFTALSEKWQDFPINMTLITQMCKPLRRDPGEFHTLW